MEEGTIIYILKSQEVETEVVKNKGGLGVNYLMFLYYEFFFYIMKFGNKKIHRYSPGIRAGAYAVGKFGAKASHIADYASPVAIALSWTTRGVKCSRGSIGDRRWCE